MPTARDRRNTRVESSTAMIRIMNSVTMPFSEPNHAVAMVISSSAKISCGIDISISTIRERTWSSAPPMVAARKPRLMPMKKASSVVTKAMPTVFWAP